MTTLAGEAREVALAEAQAVHAASGAAHYADLVAQVGEGEVSDVELLESVLELGMQAGRIRAHYGPGGEQAVLRTLRQLPRGKARAESAREVTDALSMFAGKPLESVRIAAVGPGTFTLSLSVDGVETSVRLDASGVRLASVAT
jgi:hypothetical protein